MTAHLVRVVPVLLVCVGAGTGPLHAQGQMSRRPVPYPVAPPARFVEAIERGTRTHSGEPGPNYWQQWTDYSLRARLIPTERRVEGSSRIVYHNRSPDSLSFVVLHLLQNLHAEGVARNEPAEVTGGIELRRVMVDGQEIGVRRRRGEIGYTVAGTIMRVYLAEPIEPGEALELDIEWAFQVPRAGAGARMGWSGDDLFHIAYWYPQMAVYDDMGGWQTDQFLGNAEFYAGFGTYDLTVEAPEGWVVIATGRLENPEEVFPEPVLERYRRAHESDDVVHVLTVDDFGPGKATRQSNDYLAWRFHADSVRDVAFSATAESMWDAARTPVGDRDGDGQTDYTLINSFYRERAPRWQHTWRYAQHAIDFLSRWTGYPYPWPHMTAMEGGGIIGGGMEFPMMTLMGDYNQRSDSALYYVTAHELAHMWVPMIVDVDETRFAWMDEGTTTFNENQARKEFFPGFDHDTPDRETYLQVARAGSEGEMMRRSDYHYPGPAYGIASYQKPASLLVALRGLLGEDTFVRGYRTYIRNWAFRQPKPWDFFNTFNTVSGRDLGWFWRSWYYETWTLDHAVGTVRQTEGGATIVIEDRGLVPMPARVTITLDNGDTVVREVRVETWLAGNTTAELTVAAEAPVVRVEIDAEEAFPDVDRSNNVWERSP